MEIFPTHWNFVTISIVADEDNLNCPFSAQSHLAFGIGHTKTIQPWGKMWAQNNGTNAQTVILFPHSWKTKANPKKVPKCLGQYALASLLRRKLVMAQARRIYGQPLFTPFDHGQLGWRQSFKNVDLLMAAHTLFRLPHIWELGYGHSCTFSWKPARRQLRSIWRRGHFGMTRWGESGMVVRINPES